jgi:hypothetical protein
MGRMIFVAIKYIVEPVAAVLVANFNCRAVEVASAAIR